jgi:hypothetical protein
MGKKCSTSKRDEKYEAPFRSPVFRWKGNIRENNEGVKWVKLVHYRVQCQALVRKRRYF